MNFRESIEINVARADHVARNLQSADRFVQVYAPTHVSAAYSRAIKRALAMAQDIRDAAKQGNDIRVMQKTAGLLGNLACFAITVFNCARLRGLNVDL